MIGKTTCAVIQTVSAPAYQNTTLFWPLSAFSATTALARASRKGRRFSSGRLSRSMKKPNSRLSAASALAPKKGRRVPYSPNIPPIAGPMMKPSPKAAPIRPKFWARLSGGEMSAI